MICGLVRPTMHLDILRNSLESFEQARSVLHLWGLRDLERGWRNLTHLADQLGLEPLQKLSRPLGRLLPRCADPDMALNNLERFLANPAGNQQLQALLEARGRILETVLQL